MADQPVAVLVGIEQDPIPINNLFGLDHLKLTCRLQGRDFRLTDVGGKVVRKLLA
jgi:hypothetical protein